MAEPIDQQIGSRTLQLVHNFVNPPATRSCAGEPIDAVYTWVDGDDPQWRTRLADALDRKGRDQGGEDARPCRYRNNDELRYSLRSLELFAPWLRKIHLVTANQRPSWLKPDTARLAVIPHESIFPDPACLPTFNSHAIETCLHRIPGLSRRFLYLNDDLFLGRSCSPEDFRLGTSAVTYFARIRLDTDLQPGQITDEACARTRQGVAAALGAPSLQWMPAHTPQLLDTVLLSELEERFPQEFAATRANCFRTADDFVLRIAYATLALSRDHCEALLDWGGPDYCFVRMMYSPLRFARDLRVVTRNRPRFFCLNDDRPEGWKGSLMALTMRAFLQRCFPRPCAFERAGAA